LGKRKNCRRGPDALAPEEVKEAPKEPKEAPEERGQEDRFSTPIDIELLSGRGDKYRFSAKKIIF
jgi:hypothetical protein